MHLGGALDESHVSDSDVQSVIGGSQSALILPSSYSFDKVQIVCMFDSVSVSLSLLPFLQPSLSVCSRLFSRGL